MSSVRMKDASDVAFANYWLQHIQEGAALSCKTIGLSNLSKTRLHVGVFMEGTGSKGVLVERDPAGFYVDYWFSEEQAINSIVERWASRPYLTNQGTLWSATSHKLVKSVPLESIQNEMKHTFTKNFSCIDVYNSTNCISFAASVMKLFGVDQAWCEKEFKSRIILKAL